MMSRLARAISNSGVYYLETQPHIIMITFQDLFRFLHPLMKEILFKNSITIKKETKSNCS